MTESAWSTGPPQNLYDGPAAVAAPNQQMDDSPATQNLPKTQENPLRFKIGNFRLPNAQNQNQGFRPSFTPRAMTSMARPGLEMVQTPKGLMPKMIAEKVFGPGGNQGIAMTREQQKNVRITKQIAWRPKVISNASKWNGMNINPNAERNFRPPTFAQSKDPPVAKKEWPPGLTLYIQRCFAKCKTDQEKDECEAYCKKLINDKIKDGSAWKIDWTKEKLAFDVLYPNDAKAQSLKRSMADRLAKKELEAAKKARQDAEEQLGNFQAAKRQRFGNILNSFNSSIISHASNQDFLSAEKKNDRANRFATENQNYESNTTLTSSFGPRTTPLKLNLELDSQGQANYKVKGTSTDIFKPYLRLTTAPEPHQVRTFETLKKSLIAVKRKWYDGAKDIDAYKTICEQFKSIRQDLTVQEIRNNFTMEVYEVHGRIALDAGDHEEFNQCKSQLKQLHEVYGLDSGNRAEFFAYEIVYYMLTKNTIDMGIAIQKLDEDLRDHKLIHHVFKLEQSWSVGNYYRFFRLYDQATIGIRALVDKFIDTQRRSSLETMYRSFKPTLPTSFVQQVLGFKLDEDECRDFLTKSGATLKNDVIDIKAGLS